MRNIILGILLVFAVFAVMGSVAAEDNGLSSVNDIGINCHQDMHDVGLKSDLAVFEQQNNESFTEVNCGDSLSADNSSSSENTVGTFDELNKDISNLSPGDTYNMDKDYVFDKNPLFGFHGITVNKDNVIINGNDHFIDGNYKTSLFKITGNNVKIFNITFIHSQYKSTHVPISKPGPKGFYDLTVKHTTDESPICWIGNNGLIENCIFSNNTALNGGAISWIGNNGVINNVLFMNNVARGVGGALYIVGDNITIESSYFINSSSLLTGEALYLDKRHGNYTIRDNLLLGGAIFGLDGAETNIDVKYLEYYCYANIGNMKINIMPYLYLAITKGNGNINENISYFLQYSKEKNIYLLNFIYKESNKYNKICFIFINSTLEDIFQNMVDNKFDVIIAKDTKADGTEAMVYQSREGKEYEKRTPHGLADSFLGWLIEGVYCALDAYQYISSYAAGLGLFGYIYDKCIFSFIMGVITGYDSAVTPMPEYIVEIYGIVQGYVKGDDNWAQNILTFNIPKLTFNIPKIKDFVQIFRHQILGVGV